MKAEEIIRNLTQKEKEKLYKYLRKEFVTIPDFNDIRTEQNNEDKILCPHCFSSDILGHGSYKGRSRYKCKKCNKTFNDYTGTAISGIKKIELFQEYLQLIIESVTIRKAAKQLKVSTKTIFDWRHKLLSAFSILNGQPFIGITECDDKQMNINEKGNKKLQRKPYKRSSDRETKRGVSNDKVSVMVATDRKGNPTMQIAKIGRIDAESVEKTLGNFINKNNTLCSDSHPSIILWAKRKELEHHTFAASKQHIKDKCYHVQHVNALDNLYERWIKRFYGVATKYLQQYLNWFVLLEKMKNSANPVMEAAKIIVGNTNAIKSFREIENVYRQLNRDFR